MIVGDKVTYDCAEKEAIKYKYYFMYNNIVGTKRFCASNNLRKLKMAVHGLRLKYVILYLGNCESWPKSAPSLLHYGEEWTYYPRY